MFLKEMFNRGKKSKQLLEEKQVVLTKSIQKSGELQEATHGVQKGALEVVMKSLQLNEDLARLVNENERTKNILLERENRIKKSGEELEERAAEIRKEEIMLETRKADVKRREQKAENRENDMTTERIEIEKREKEAERIRTGSEEAKVKYEEFYKELEEKNEAVSQMEEKMKKQLNAAEEANAAAQVIHEKARVIDEEIRKKEDEFEKSRIEIEASLREKMDEYDRRIADLENAEGIAEGVKFDKSKEGTEAKIVVKEAIRQAKKTLTDAKTKFDELDEKYSDGTFKGFSIPLEEIDRSFSDLKFQYGQIKEHLETNESLPGAAMKWLLSIEECIIQADKCIKSWEFSEGYRYIIKGLATCRNYELLLTILNEWEGSTTSGATNNSEEDFTNWYEVLGVSENATLKEIKNRRNELIMQYHPDRAPDDMKDEYNARTIQINKAYEVLSDKDERKAFDEKLRNHKHK